MADKENTDESTRSPASKLDNLSREDLVKFVKKQTILLQKTRGKCDDLSKKVLQLQSSQNKADSGDRLSEGGHKVKDLEHQLKEIEAEREEMLTAYNSVQQAQEQSIQKFQEFEEELSTLKKKNEDLEAELAVTKRGKKDLEEQTECMKMKDESLISTLKCLQQDNMDLQEQIKLLTEARDEIIQKFKGIQHQEPAANGDSDTENGQELHKLCDSLKEEKTSLNTKIQELSEAKLQLEATVEHVRSDYEQQRRDVASLQADLNFVVGEVQQTKASLAAEKSNAEQLESELDRARKETEEEKETAKHLQQMIDELSSQCEMLRSKVDDGVMEAESNSQLKLELRQLKQVNKQLMEGKETHQYELTELQEEKEMLEHEMAGMKEQMEEWDGLMQMLKNDKEHAMSELENGRKEADQVVLMLRKVVVDPEQQEEEQRRVQRDAIHELDRSESVSSDLFLEEEEEKTLLTEVKHVWKLTNILINEKLRLQKQLNDAYSSKGDSLVEVQGLKREMEDLRMEKEAIEREKESLSVVVQLAQERKQEFEEELTTLKSELDKLEAENQELARKLANLGDIEAIEKMKLTLEENALKIPTLESEIKTLLKKTESLQHEKTILEQELSDRQQYSQEIETKVIELSNNLSTMRKKYENVQTENESLVHTAEVTTGETESRLVELNRELTELKTEKFKLDHEMEELRGQFHHSRTEVLDLNNHLVSEEGRLAELHEEYNGILDRNETLVKDLSRLQLEVETLNNDKEQLTEENQKLSKLVGNISDRDEKEHKDSTEIEKLTAKIDEMAEDAKQNVAEITKLQDELAAISGDVEQLNVKLESTNQQREEASTEKEKFDLELGEKATQIANLEKQVQDQIDLAQNLESVVEEEGNHIAELSEQVNSSKKEVERLKTEANSDLEKQVQQLTETNINLESLAEERLSSITDLEGHMKSFHAEIESLKLDIEKNETIADQVREEKLKLESQLVETRIQIATLQSENAQLSTVAESLKLGASGSEQETADLKSTVEQLKFEKEAASKGVQLKEQEIANLTEQLEDAKKLADERGNETEAANPEVQSGKDEILKLSNQMAELMKSKESVENDFESRQQEIQDLNSRVEDVKKRVDETECENETFSRKLNAKEEELKTVIVVKTRLEEESIELRRQMESLASQGGESLSKMSDLEKNHLDLQQELEMERQRLLGVTQEKNLALEHIETLESDLSSLSEKYVKLELMEKELRGEKEQLSKAISEKEEIIVASRQEICAIQEKLVSENEYSQLNSMYIELEKEKNNLNSLLESRKQEEEEIFSKLDCLSRERESLTIKLSLAGKLLMDVRHAVIEEQDSDPADVDLLNGEEGSAMIEFWRSDILGLIQTRQKEYEEVSESMKSLKVETVALHAKLRDMKLTVEEKQKTEESEDSKTDEMKVLQKQLKSKEDLCNKLKTLAVKGKKEVAEGKSRIEMLSKEKTELASRIVDLEESLRSAPDHNQTMQQAENLKSLHVECDRLHDELELEKSRRKTSEQDLQKNVDEKLEVKQRYEEVQTEKGGLVNQIEATISEKKAIEASLNEHRTKLKALETERDTFRIQIEEINNGKQQLNAKISEQESVIQKFKDDHAKALQQLQEKLEGTEQKLSQASQEAKQSSMMDLEIADYERTLENLNSVITEKDGQISSLETEVERVTGRVNSLQKEIDSLEEQRLQSDDRANKLKQLLVKTKKDLADSKKLDTEQKTANAQLQGQLEHLTQQAEEYKVQLADISGENQKLQQRAKTSTDSIQRTLKSLEIRIQSLQDDLEVSRSEATALQAEYDSYKVRVHNVLKQQKTKSPQDGSADTDRLEKQRLETVVEQLKTKLEESSAMLRALKQENEILQENHERLLQRHNKLLQDLNDKDVSFKQRLEELSRQSASSNVEQSETIQQLSAQNELLTETFKGQIKTSQEEHQKMVIMLQHQLEMAENENYRLQQDNQALQQSLASQPTHISAQGRGTREETPAEFMDIRQVERQSGEGMENIDADNCPRNTTKRVQSPVTMTFDQLINSAAPDDLQSLKSQESIAEETSQTTLATSQKKIDHLSQLLSDSEVTIMRMTEQAKILKDEIRRLERNTEREKETRNLEYLKNILMKGLDNDKIVLVFVFIFQTDQSRGISQMEFLSLNVGDERRQLIPVLTTMLKLSAEEKAQLHAIAEGEEGVPAQSSGWGAYLHRWTSLT